MALRMIELYLPKEESRRVHKVLRAAPIAMLGSWEETVSETRVLVRALVPAEETQAGLDLSRVARAVRTA